MIRFTVTWLLFFVLLAFPGCSKVNDVYTIRVCLWANDQHTWYQAFVHFAELLDERSQGRIAVEVYPSEQLAKEIEAIRLLQAGVIEMTVTGALLSNWVEVATFCEMPFMLKDSLDRDRLLRGPLGKRIVNDIQTKMDLRPLGYFLRGPRQLTSNRPIRHPDELQGLLLRVPNVPTFVTAWNAMGAKPTPMSFSEVFTSLQQGTIEAQENPLSLIYNAGFAEVQKYVNMTDHVMSWSYPIISERAFQKIPTDLQDVFLQAAVEMQAYESKLFTDNEKRMTDALTEKGMEFVEVDKQAFQDACGRAIYDRLSPEMQLLYDDFINESID